MSVYLPTLKQLKYDKLGIPEQLCTNRFLRLNYYHLTHTFNLFVFFFFWGGGGGRGGCSVFFVLL